MSYTKTNIIKYPPKLPSKQRRGYIYIYYNESYNYLDKNIYKIGRSTDPKSRIINLNTSQIFYGEYKYISPICKDNYKAERKISKRLQHHKIHHEIYNININVAVDIIENIIKQINNHALLPIFYIVVTVLFNMFKSYFGNILCSVKVFIS